MEIFHAPIEKSRTRHKPVKYLRKEGTKYIYNETKKHEKLEGFEKIKSEAQELINTVIEIKKLIKFHLKLVKVNEHLYESYYNKMTRAISEKEENKYLKLSQESQEIAIKSNKRAKQLQTLIDFDLETGQAKGPIVKKLNHIFGQIDTKWDELYKKNNTKETRKYENLQETIGRYLDFAFSGEAPGEELLIRL